MTLLRKLLISANLLLAISILSWLGTGVVHARESDKHVDFATQVKPLLARRCFACHGPETGEGGLHLDNPETALAELDSGLHAIVPGDPESSELLTRVSSTDEFMRMPPEGEPLKSEEIDALKRWIEQGAEWKKHWAFIPPKPQSPPQVKQTNWVKNPIDAFILADLEAAELSPAPAADKRTLARRAYFNLIGLPPTNEELDDFIADSRPDAWLRLIDRLLDSEHYGEQWARHWLDVVRYAETNSFERDGPKPNAWKYRDYVIRSFNDDKPYDQFVKEQLAGDELDMVTHDSVIATGYYRLGIWDDEPADPVQALADEKDDLVSTTGQAFLGLTVGCARCHDHKIDPIPQRDYFGFVSFFADVTSYGTRGDENSNSQWTIESEETRKQRQEYNAEIGKIEREKISMEEVGIKRMSAIDQRRSETPERQELLDDKLEKFLNNSEWKLFRDTLDRLNKVRRKRDELPAAEAVLALARCEPQPEPTRLAVRGNPHVLDEVVEPHFPQLFNIPTPRIPIAKEEAHSAGRRRVLADWIASPDNMLTARVIVNRVWQHHFGRGIVRSTNNFGELGDPPTHPELLDWLALWLIEHDWQLKPLHRLIMSSNAYQMSSASNDEALAIDPMNDLFWRFDMRRLSAEELRDATLVTTGKFNPQLYGPSIYPEMSAEVLATQSQPGQGWGESSLEEQSRRSIYIHVKRSLILPQLAAFDFPDVDSTCEARFVTTQPQQALTMLNGSFFNEQAQHLAERVRATSSNNAQAQVATALRLALGRKATQNEIRTGVNLMNRLRKKHSQQPEEALRYWCLTVLNLNEYVYLD
jgi:mono/diheme cytochrome c family protein